MNTELIWNSWLGLMHYVEFMEADGNITGETASQMRDKLLNLKKPVQDYIEAHEKDE